MKTVEAIIERLRKMPTNNGCYAVLNDNLERFEKANAEIKRSVSKPKVWLSLLDERDRLETKLLGFIWGLRAADFIDDAELRTAGDELQEACK